jgi:two-component system response regulator GlrR
MHDAPDVVIAPFATAKRNFELRYVTSLLEHTRGNVTHAARIAQKHRSDFHCLLRKLEIKAEDFRRPRSSRLDSQPDAYPKSREPEAS